MILTEKPNFQRLLLKISGEHFNDLSNLVILINKIKVEHQIIIMCGGGNVFRGAQNPGNREYTDRIGMLSTIMNGISLKVRLGQNSCIFNTFPIDIAEEYNIPKINKEIEKGSIPILCGGLGCGFISTDTAMVVRGLELKCDLVVKVSKVPYIYDYDPSNPGAKPILDLNYDQAAALNAMDESAVCIAKTNKTPIMFTNIDNLAKSLNNTDYCTIIH